MRTGLSGLGFTVKSILLVAALLMVAIARVAEAQTPDITTVAYRPDLGAASPRLDVTRARGAQKAPVLVYVHGGGWQAGDKARVHDKPAHFTAQGYVFVSLDYRLLPEVPVETQLQDIDAALGWIAAHIGDFGGDAGNLHLMGHSAGAHLASMTGLAPLSHTAPLIESGALRSVISNDIRAYDIAQLAMSGRTGLPPLYTKVFGKDPQRWARLSPVSYIDPARNNPAFLVLYSGAGNATQRRDIAVTFAQNLQAAGIVAETFDGRAYSHSQMNTGIGTIDDLTGAIDGFLNRVARW